MSFTCMSRRAATSRCLKSFAASMSSYLHLTQAQLRIYAEHLDRKPRLPRSPVPQKTFPIQSLRPSFYDATVSSWTADFNPNGKATQRGSILRLVSWNLDMSSPAPADRVSAALKELEAHFGASPKQLVVMVQEICYEMSQAIMDNPWVRRNFTLSNLDGPTSSYTDIAGDSFVMKRLDWSAAPYFTMMLISRDVAVVSCFRAPLVSNMGRDALVVDVAVGGGPGRDQATKALRLCTTHLESLWEGQDRYRPTQLRGIADLLKGASSLGSTAVGGIVGGDMNAIDRAEHELHRTDEVGLKDAWEDVPAPEASQLKPGKKDLTYGRAKGNTWGYQSLKGWMERKRLDKFFYTGSIETVAVEGVGDVTGKIGRIGIGLETEAMVWERYSERDCTRGKKCVTKSFTEVLSQRTVDRMIERTGRCDPKLVHKKRKIWASDHFGIVLGVKVL